jgi:hypothetical protein
VGSERVEVTPEEVARRGSHASVASAGTIGRTPLNRPKFDSIPQMATMIRDGTPYRSLI